MSLNRINFNFSLSALLRRAVPYWTGIVIFSLAAFIVILFIFRNQDQIKARQQLQHYRLIYRQSGSAGLQLAYSTAREDSGSFLRLEGPGLRLILVSSNTRNAPLQLPDFTHFAKSDNLTWHALQHGSVLGPWTVAAAPLADGNTLQFGINSQTSLQQLRRIGLGLVLLTLLSLLLCLIPARFSLSGSNRSLRRVTRMIKTLTIETDHELVLDSKKSADEADLLSAVNHLLKRQRNLTRELQESMDNVAHDLRTPITRLRTIAEYGLHHKENTRHLSEALTDCLEESDRLLTMLNTMLTVAEAEAETVKLNFQPVSLTASISDVVDLYSIIAEEQGAEIYFEPEEDLVILADPQRISQVWANLVDNAVKYNASKITLNTHRQDDTACITLQDNGMGISENEINRIWKRLFRGDRSRSKPGLGLGLTLVRATVNSHNGTIAVSSTLNKGTTFTITLPLA